VPPPRELTRDAARGLETHREGKHHSRIDGTVVKLADARGAAARLRVHVIGATGLVGADSPRGGEKATSDPFADVWLEGSYWRTASQKHTTDPTWSDPPQEMPATALDSLLHVVVFDYDVLKRNDYLGEVVLSLRALADGSAREGWCELHCAAGRATRVSGSVHLKLQLLDAELLGAPAIAAPLATPRSAPRSRAGSSLPSERGGRTASQSVAEPPASLLHRSSGTSIGVGSGGRSRATTYAEPQSPTLPSSRPHAQSVHSARGSGGSFSGSPGAGAGLTSLVMDERALMKRLDKHRSRPIGENLVQFMGDGAATKKEIKHVRREDTQSVLTLRLLGASKLRSADSNGMSDPYCEAWVFSMKDQAPEHMWRTATRRRTLEPKWDDTQKCPLTSGDFMVHLVVCDWDQVGSDDFLGEALITLQDHAPGRPQALQVTLDKFSSSIKDTITGHVNLELTISETHHR
jgi:hypothetical protein